MPTSPDADTLQSALDALRSGRIQAPAFCEAARRSPMLAQLPPRYAEVLATLLDRLEASALFTEESCSFSQSDLLDGVQSWLDKARDRLASA